VAIVFFHAHPDDEAIFTGGTIALLTAGGARVVLVVATSGERGEVRGELRPGESLEERRLEETRRAAEILGISRVEFLGYADSGMLGEPTNEAPGSFFSADRAAAAGRLAEILDEEDAETLVVYDERGIYGHPDHVMVHHVGVDAASIRPPVVLYEATVDREYLHFVERHLVADAGASMVLLEQAHDLRRWPIGVPSVEVTTIVDVRSVLDRKRAAMAAHGSQIPEMAPVLGMSDATFAEVYGFEWYVRRGAPGPIEAL